MNREQRTAQLHNNYVGKLMRHTPKAVARGYPADRIFAVCLAESGKAQHPGDRDEPPHLVAWKCTLQPNGRIDHPAYKISLAPTDARLFSSKRAKNDAEPTATFRPDSLYMLVP